MKINDETMNIEKMHPVIALINPTDRQKKRAIMQDYEKIAGELLAVEAEFYKHLFDDTDNTYDDIYVYFLSRYKQVAEVLERCKKLKALMVNRTYFHDMMCPMEKERRVS